MANNSKSPTESEYIKKLETRIEKLERQERWAILIPIIVALIGATASFIVTRFQETNRLKLTIAQEEVQLKSDIILKAIETGNSQEAATNLAFFVKIGFIDDTDGKILTALNNPTTIPVLPKSSIDSNKDLLETVRQLIKDSSSEKLVP